MERKFNGQQKRHIRRGDTVLVLSGDDRGKKGKVLEILTHNDRVIVEGVNIVTKHEKPTAKTPDGALKKTEAAIHISNLMLIDPATGKPTRTGRKRNAKDQWQRYSKSTKEFIK